MKFILHLMQDNAVVRNCEHFCGCVRRSLQQTSYELRTVGSTLTQCKFVWLSFVKYIERKKYTSATHALWKNFDEILGMKLVLGFNAYLRMFIKTLCKRPKFKNHQQETAEPDKVTIVHASSHVILLTQSIFVIGFSASLWFWNPRSHDFLFQQSLVSLTWQNKFTEHQILGFP